jgi:hypothetical protein
VEDKDDGTGGQEGATSKKMFPESRKGALNGTLLETLGFTKERMVQGNALFFNQLLLPMYNPKISGIEADPQRLSTVRSKPLSTCMLSKLGLVVDHMDIGLRIQFLMNLFNSMA